MSILLNCKCWLLCMLENENTTWLLKRDSCPIYLHYVPVSIYYSEKCMYSDCCLNKGFLCLFLLFIFCAVRAGDHLQLVNCTKKFGLFWQKNKPKCFPKIHFQSTSHIQMQYTSTWSSPKYILTKYLTNYL